MRVAVWGLLVLAICVWAVAGLAAPDAAPPAGGERPLREALANGEFIAFDTPVGDKIQQIIVIDPRRRSIGVYHVELGTGKIELKSVRRIDSDLDIEQYNTARPLPHEIRAQLMR